MGIDVTNRLIVGVRYFPHRKTGMDHAEVTRYDNITGKPYTDTVSTRWTFVGTRRFNDSEFFAWKEECWEEEPDTLRLFFLGDEPEIFGMEIRHGRSFRSNADEEYIVAATMAEIRAAIVICRQRLRDEFGINDEPEVFAFADVG